MDSTRVALGGLVAVLAVTLVGCSDGWKDAIPENVCGVKAEKDTVSSLLPDGDSIKEVHPKSHPGTSRCSLLVDGKFAMEVSESRVDRPYDPMDEQASYRFTHRQPMQDLSFDGRAAVGDFEAIASTKCGTEKAKFLIIDIRIDKAREDDVKQRRKDIERFTKAIVPGIKKKLNCSA